MTSITHGRLLAEIEGTGTPVVMVHGLGGTSNTFQPLMQDLAGYRVVRPDLPGSGRSPVTHEAPTIATFAQAIADAVRAFGAAPAHFVGHSLGTIVVQAIAAEQGDLVASMTLLGALIEPSEQARDGLRARARTARTEGMIPIADAIVVNTLSPSTRSGSPAVAAFVRESLMRQDREGYARTCEALAGARAVDHRLIKAPTLIIAGQDDPVAPASVGQLLSERIAGARLVVLERCGHWIPLEQPAETSRRVRDFVGSMG